MPSIDDLVGRLAIEIAADEAGAREMLTHNAAARARGLASTLWDEEDQDAQRALREVVFKRAILDMHAELWRLYRTFEQAGEPGLISLGRAQGLSRVLERLAFVYGDDGI